MKAIITDKNDNTPIVVEVTEAYICDYIDVPGFDGENVSIYYNHTQDGVSVLTLLCANEDDLVAVVLPVEVAESFIQKLFDSDKIDLREYWETTFFNADIQDASALVELGFEVPEGWTD